MSTVFFQILSSSLLSPDEVSKSAHLLNSTRDHLVQDVDHLSDAQWHFRPAADSWSIAETLEHIVLIEERVHSIIGQMPDAPPAEADGNASQTEEVIVTQIPVRTVKLKAPPHVSPTHRWRSAETLSRFVESRARTLELLADSPCLRGHVIPHPVLGPWDGYQWILAAAAHSARHTNQIREIKTSADFPAPDAPTS